MGDLSDRRKLFEEELPRWEGIIASLAYKLLTTRAIDRGLLGLDDIQNELRLEMWKAIEKYEEGRGTALNTWITKLLRQRCRLITQAHYNKQPRDAEGRVQIPLPLHRLQEDGQDWFLDIEDPRAEAAFDVPIEQEWFDQNVDLVFKVLEHKKSIDEPRAFQMILSGGYKTDREIGDILGVNFAKVGEVRFKAKVVFALALGIPTDKFTHAKNAEKIAKRLRTRLRPYLKDLHLASP